MPVIWSSTVDGVQRKLYGDKSGFRVSPGFSEEAGQPPKRVERLATTADDRLQNLRRWLGRETLPADLLAALQDFSSNTSSSETGTSGVRAAHRTVLHVRR